MQPLIELQIHDDMDEDTKRLKLDGVAPKTPPQTDSEDDLPIEEIREKRKEDSKARKEKLKEERKKQMKDFQKSLGPFSNNQAYFVVENVPILIKNMINLISQNIFDESFVLQSEAT